MLLKAHPELAADLENFDMLEPIEPPHGRKKCVYEELKEGGAGIFALLEAHNPKLMAACREWDAARTNEMKKKLNGFCAPFLAP